MIVVLLVIFGRYVDQNTSRLKQKEEEKRVIFNATVTSTQHILNNILNQMQYYKILAEQANAFDDEVSQSYEETIKEGKELVEKLSSVDILTAENIKESVAPQVKE